MEGNMELWQMHVGDRIDSRGLNVFFVRGKTVMVEGEEFVRDNLDGMTRRNELWLGSKAEAQLKAAERVEALAHVLIKQAEELREAAHAPA